MVNFQEFGQAIAFWTQAKSPPPDLMLLDLDLPKVSWASAVQNLRCFADYSTCQSAAGTDSDRVIDDGTARLAYQRRNQQSDIYAIYYCRSFPELLCENKMF